MHGVGWDAKPHKVEDAQWHRLEQCGCVLQLGTEQSHELLWLLYQKPFVCRGEMIVCPAARALA